MTAVCSLLGYHSVSSFFDQSSSSQETVVIDAGQSMQLVVPSHPLTLGSFRVEPRIPLSSLTDWRVDHQAEAYQLMQK